MSEQDAKNKNQNLILPQETNREMQIGGHAGATVPMLIAETVEGGRHPEVPAHHNAEPYIDDYLKAAGIAEARKKPLFRSFNRRLELTQRGLHRTEALLMIKRCARREPRRKQNVGGQEVLAHV